MSDGACNSGCFNFRYHSDSNYIVCVKCGEIYLKIEMEQYLNRKIIC